MGACGCKQHEAEAEGPLHGQGVSAAKPTSASSVETSAATAPAPEAPSPLISTSSAAALIPLPLLAPLEPVAPTVELPPPLAVTTASASSSPVIPPNSIGLTHLANFLSATECSELLVWFDLQPKAGSHARTRVIVGSPLLSVLPPPLVATIQQRIRQQIDKPASSLTTLWLVRSTAGAILATHRDGPGHTFLIYLDTLKEADGGETNFPHLGVKFRPMQGNAITWCTPRSSTSNWFAGIPSDDELHEGMPVKSGVKTILLAHFR